MDIKNLIIVLKKVDYRGDNQLMNIAGGYYEIPTIGILIRRFLRLFKKRIIVNE